MVVFSFPTCTRSFQSLYILSKTLTISSGISHFFRIPKSKAGLTVSYALTRSTKSKYVSMSCALLRLDPYLRLRIVC
jgi:hypothetical protein